MARNVFFYESLSPKLEFCKNQDWMNVIECCMMIGWTYLVFVIPSFFLLQPGRVSDKNTRRNISQLYLYARFARALQQEGEHSCYDLRVLVLGHKACPWETFKMCFGEVVSLPTPTYEHLS
jgi:hypothetical protein